MTAPSIKRSEVNRIMRESDKFIRSFGYIMPPFAYWTPAEFKARKIEAQAIIDKNAQIANGFAAISKNRVAEEGNLFSRIAMERMGQKVSKRA